MKAKNKSMDSVLDAWRDDPKCHVVLDEWARHIYLTATYGIVITEEDLRLIHLLKGRLAHHSVEESECGDEGYPVPQDEL